MQPSSTDYLVFMPSSPPISLIPKGIRDFLEVAIIAGGGVPVEPNQAEGIIWTDPSDPKGLRDLLDTYPHVRWVQLPWAGIEPYLDVLDHDRIWTAGKGVYAEEVAEHALGLALSGMRNIANYARVSTWGLPVGTSLHGTSVTILGAGGIATSLIRLLRPFGCHITALRRHDIALADADQTATLNALPTVFPKTDLLVLALALTPETKHIINATTLALLPRHSWLVNVARGQHVITDDLVNALKSDVIAGAALDVTDPEPLPDDHPLWSLPQCIITPHIANTPEMAIPVLAKRVTENVRRFGANEELIGIVDVQAGY